MSNLIKKEEAFVLMERRISVKNNVVIYQALKNNGLILIYYKIILKKHLFNP
jgi:hypothetical protein